MAKCARFSTSLRLPVWEKELQDDIDRDFLLQGIREGFCIVDPGSEPRPATVPNYKSALNVRSKIDAEIRKGIAEQHYVLAEVKPNLTSAIGAVPKPNGDVRLIHDCSRPAGSSVNDYAQDNVKLRYQTMADAVSLLTPGCWLAKVDLKGAYRSVGLHPSQFGFTGLQWQFTGDPTPTYLYDTRLPFGARKSPSIFHRLTQSVRRMMQRRGYTILVYLDDFLIVADSKRQCQLAMDTLLSLLRQLGFAIAWEKTIGPTQYVVFLGIAINTMTFSLHLPEDKVKSFRTLLASYRTRSRATLRQLQQLAGKLSWAAHVIHGGRIYLQRVLNTLRPLRKPHHKAPLTPEFHSDINWWLTYLDHFNCKRLLHSHRDTIIITTDASNTGGSMICKNDWAYVNWELDLPSWTRAHINTKETLAIVAAVYRWAPQWQGKRVYVFTDNVTARASINRGVCRDPDLMTHLRNVFWLATMYDFDLRCHSISGKDNHHADTVSRMDTPGHFQSWYSIITRGLPVVPCTVLPNLSGHMSNHCLYYFLSQMPRLLSPWLSWMPKYRNTAACPLPKPPNVRTMFT